MHATYRKNAKDRNTADVHEHTIMMRCVVQNGSSAASGRSGSGGGGDGSGGGGGGGADGRGMEGGGVVGDGGGSGGGGFGLGEGGDCATTPTINTNRVTHVMLRFRE